MAQNAGKRSLSISPSRKEATSFLSRLLVRRTPELSSRFLARHGLGYDDVAAVNDTVVYASISAFGQTGPHGHRPGFDDVVQATSGFMATNKRDNGPVRTGGPVLDYATGMHATSAILAALLLRDRTGERQRVDVAMQDVTMLLVNYETAAASQHGGVRTESPDQTCSDGSRPPTATLCLRATYPATVRPSPPPSDSMNLPTLNLMTSLPVATKFKLSSRLVS